MTKDELLDRWIDFAKKGGCVEEIGPCGNNLGCPFCGARYYVYGKKPMKHKDDCLYHLTMLYVEETA